MSQSITMGNEPATEPAVPEDQKAPTPGQLAQGALDEFFAVDQRARKALEPRFYVQGRQVCCGGCGSSGWYRGRVLDARGILGITDDDLEQLAAKLNGVVAPWGALENVACVDLANKQRERLHELTGDVLATP